MKSHVSATHQFISQDLSRHLCTATGGQALDLELTGRALGDDTLFDLFEAFSHTVLVRC